MSINLDVLFSFRFDSFHFESFSSGFLPPREALLLSSGFFFPREALLCSSVFHPSREAGAASMMPRLPEFCIPWGFCSPREAGAASMTPRSPAGEALPFIPGFCPPGKLFVVPRGFVPQGKLGRCWWCRARQRVLDGGSAKLGHTSNRRRRCSATGKGRCCSKASILFSRHGRGERTLAIYIEEHLEVVKRWSLIVSLVMVLGVRPVCPDATVCILSVLPTRGTLQYVGINSLYLHCDKFWGYISNKTCFCLLQSL